MHTKENQELNMIKIKAYDSFEVKEINDDYFRHNYPELYEKNVRY